MRLSPIKTLSRFHPLPGLFLGLLLQAVEPASREGGPFLLIEEGRLAELKSTAANPSDPNVPADVRAISQKILKEAKKRVGQPVITITANKNLQASRDPHDYFSTARYYWPDPSKPDGQPYIRRDGETNPEHDEVSDEKMLNELVKSTEYLALAHFITGDGRYASEAVRLLRGFFLDEETRMNPNLNYSQSVPGGVQGRGSGVIDAREFMRLPDVLALVDSNAAWTEKDRKAMKAWWSEYAEWLQTSKIGLEERAAGNNHGAAYDVQLAAVLVMAGKPEEARKVLGESLPARLDAHITAEGKQPRELARTKSWSYSCFNLKNICKGGVMAQALGVQFWDHQGPEGRGSLKKAMLFLVPFLKNPGNWPEKQITKFEPKEARYWLNVGAVVYGDESIRQAQEEFAPMDKADIQDWISTPTRK